MCSDKEKYVDDTEATFSTRKWNLWHINWEKVKDMWYVEWVNYRVEKTNWKITKV